MNVQRLRARDPRGVGPYQFLGRLGSGGMGLVCLARAADGRLVAVKLVHQEIAADPDYRRRFAREVRAAKAVTGRFTAAVLDADPDAPQPWYAAEFIDGPTLGEVVRSSGPIPPRALRALAAGLADALAALETAGLVHRDVKPDNILLAPDGPKLIDFGLAHRETDSILTRAGSVLGSPGYMSPEQIAGRGATTASDVFALGAVLAYAIQGHGPFGAGPSEARMYRARFSEAQLAGVPDEFRPLLARCLAKEPTDRPTPHDLIALWPVRLDELATLIQVGRSHHAAAQPPGDRHYGAPADAARAKAAPATDANSPTEALPLERGPSALPGGPATAGLKDQALAPNIQPPQPAAAPGLPGAAVAGNLPVLPGAGMAGGQANQAAPPLGFQPPEPAAAPGLLAGPPNQHPPHIPLPEPAAPSPLPALRRPERTPTSITFQPPTAEPWHSPLPHVPSHPAPPPPAPRPSWWHHPVAADRLPGGGLRDALLGLAGAGLLMLFGLLPAGSAVGVAFAATALALGFLLGVRRSALAMAVYNATAVLSPHILPGGLASELKEPAAGVSLEVLVLLLAAGGVARVGGLAWPPLGFVVGGVAYVAGQAVIISMAAHQGGGGFVTVWRADTDGLLIYRDAAIAAGCGAAVGFLALLGSSKAVVDADGPYRATGVNR